LNLKNNMQNLKMVNSQMEVGTWAVLRKRGLCGLKRVVQVEDVAVQFVFDSKPECYSKDAGICPSGCYINGNIWCVSASDLLLLKCVTVSSNLV